MSKSFFCRIIVAGDDECLERLLDHLRFSVLKYGRQEGVQILFSQVLLETEREAVSGDLDHRTLVLGILFNLCASQYWSMEVW